jgi:dipeptidyl aminopeptidase/acylaminoacyl peptidase
MTGIPFSSAHAQQLKLVRDACFVGDDRHICYSVAEIDDELRETHSLWLFDLADSGTRRIGEGLTGVDAPAPSPDGESFAVLAEVEGIRQICLIPVDGGPARPLTALPQGVSGRPAWSPDGRSIAFTAGPAQRRDPSLPYRVDRVTYRFERVGYLDDVVTDVYVVDVASGSTRQLTSDRCMNSDPRWSPDGRSLSYLVSFPPDRMWTGMPELHVLAVEDGKSSALVSGWGAVLRAAWCGDGERIAFVGHPAEGYLMTNKWDLWTIDATGGEPECRTETLLPGVGAGIQAASLSWELHLSATRICVHHGVAYISGQVGGDVVIYRVSLSGPEAVERVVETHGSSAYLVDIGREGETLSVVTSFVEPPELMLGTKRITSLNDELVGMLSRPDLKELQVTASDGLQTEAWALTPPGEEGPWPSVLYIHGGPYGAFGSTYMIDFQLLVGAGFAVVFHNFRGSRGYGSEFSHKIVGKWGPAGSLDHHATVDEAISAGIADPERVGVCGYSHGSFATCWLVGTSDRFKAAVAENGSTDWTSKFGNTDWPFVVELEMGGTPLDAPEAYRELSALTYAPNCKTPVLFVVGEDDLRCHPVESQQYYRVLKSNGVPTEMLRLPNSSHLGTWDGPIPARIAQNEALVDWFKRYLAPVEGAKQTLASPTSEALQTETSAGASR